MNNFEIVAIIIVGGWLINYIIGSIIAYREIKKKNE